MAVLVDVGRRTKGRGVDGVQSLVEQLAERLQLRRGESIRRRESVDVDKDVAPSIREARLHRGARGAGGIREDVKCAHAPD